jgi:hypothetical protein
MSEDSRQLTHHLVENDAPASESAPSDGAAATADSGFRSDRVILCQGNTDAESCPDFVVDGDGVCIESRRVHPGFLYAATCPGLETFAREAGFVMRHIGFAEDVDARIAALNATAYGSVGLSPDTDRFAWEAGWSTWRLVPLDVSMRRNLRFAFRGGMLQIPLPIALAHGVVAKRLISMLSPFEAVRLVAFPSAVINRDPVNLAPVCGYRYSLYAQRHIAVRDIYRFDAGMTDILAAAIFAAVFSEDHAGAAHRFTSDLDLAVHAFECIGATELLAAA